MNRIIIIGNGFDLAHGLKTRYKDFIDYILETEKSNVIDKIGKPNFNVQYVYNDDLIYVTSPCSLSEIRNINYKAQGLEFFEEINKLNISEYVGNYKVALKVQYVNYFFSKLIANNNLCNWVDIEYEYYKALMECVNDERKYGIKTLNIEFEKIKNALEKYLSIQMKNEYNLSEKIMEKLKLIIKPVEVKGYNASNLDDNILILNFNYTNVIEKYLSTYFQFSKNKIKCIYIHGQLENPNNKIIFGYGDELDKDYSLIERKNNNMFLDNIKSIKYSETKNYNELMAYLQPYVYEIYIMGHSCGVSDKTLLNTLFENLNCSMIKIFYHKISENEDNYIDVYKNISRVFTDKQRMRKIVLNKQDCVPLI
jgi:hypothetical protein